jgi:hypothetical protein
MSKDRKEHQESVRRAVRTSIPSNKPKQPEPAKEPEASADDADTKGKVRQTLHLPPAVHEQLRQLAFRKRVSQQELFRRALDLLFTDETVPLWDELVNPKPKA